MKRIPAEKFKSHCLSLIEDVRRNRQTVLITKGGKPVAKLVPADEGFIGRLKGMIEIVGDIESPVVPAEAWESVL